MTGCAVHPGRASVGTCPRCGRFRCAECTAANPCLECQVVQFHGAKPPSAAMVTTVGALVSVYCVLTLLVIPLGAEVDLTQIKRDLLKPMVLAYLASGAVYLLGYFGLIAAFLVWYATLVGWARGRGLTSTSTGTAIGFWFVPLANFVQPYQLLRTIQQGAGLKAPVALWWAAFSATNVFQFVALFRSDIQASSLPGVASAVLEIAAALLCWRVVGDLTKAAAAWRPVDDLALRDAASGQPASL